MIKSFQIGGAKGTFLEGLPIYDKKLTFTPGVNVIYGPNGCGKTTVLRMIAVLTSLHGIRQGNILDGSLGLPNFNVSFEDWVIEEGRVPPEKAADRLPDYLFRMLFRLDRDIRSRRQGYPIAKTLRAKITLDWEKSPVFLIEGKGAFSTVTYFGQSPYGTVEEVAQIMDQRTLSAGQAVYARLKRLLAQLENAKVPYYGRVKGVNSLWVQRCRVWDAWLDKFEAVEGSPLTLLLDEPDLSLAPMAQQKLWEALNQLSAERNVQVIAVSHSPFCLAADNVLEIGDGYVKDSVAAIMNLARTLVPTDPLDDSLR